MQLLNAGCKSCVRDVLCKIVMSILSLGNMYSSNQMSFQLIIKFSIFINTLYLNKYYIHRLY